MTQKSRTSSVRICWGNNASFTPQLVIAYGGRLIGVAENTPEDLIEAAIMAVRNAEGR